MFDQIHGKEISYNNLLDINAAVDLIDEFEDLTFAILKHNNACGLASRPTVLEAWKDALAGDPVSAFGGVLITNGVIDKAAAAFSYTHLDVYKRQVINCDDFYGRDSFQVMGKFLSALPADSKNVYSMVGFRVGNTLSESGTVSRGICSTDDNGLLTSVVERTKIQRLDGEVKYIDDNGEWTATPEDVYKRQPFVVSNWRS